MEFLLNFLLNYITLSVAGIAFVLILAVLIWKRKALSSKDKGLLIVLLAILAIYFGFVLMVTITSGSIHPAGEPTPIATIENDLSQTGGRKRSEHSFPI